MDLTFVIQDQALREIEQCFDVLEICVLGGTQIFFVIWSEMKCRLHRTSSISSPTGRLNIGRAAETLEMLGIEYLKILM